MRQVLLLLFEVQRRRVHAEARAGRPGTVGEDVPQVRIALSTQSFHTPHAVAHVGFRAHLTRIHRRREAGPSGARFKLGGAIE